MPVETGPPNRRRRDASASCGITAIDHCAADARHRRVMTSVRMSSSLREAVKAAVKAAMDTADGA